MDFERDVKFCVALLPFLRVSYDRYNTWGLKFSITFSKYLNIRHGYSTPGISLVFFRFLIRNKYLQNLHGYAWDLNSLFLFSHPLACYNGRPARFRLLATFNLRLATCDCALALVFCCADIEHVLSTGIIPGIYVRMSLDFGISHHISHISYLLLPLRMVKEG